MDLILPARSARLPHGLADLWIRWKDGKVVACMTEEGGSYPLLDEERAQLEYPGLVDKSLQISYTDFRYPSSDALPELSPA